MQKKSEFINVVTQEWLRRQKINRRYSLRAYANSLAISPSRLSDLLNGKGGISASRAVELAERLSLSEDELEKLHLIIQKEMTSAKSIKTFASGKLRQQKKKFSYERSLSCRTMIDRLTWEHLYITELVSDESLSEEQMAKRLGIHPRNLSHLLKEAQDLQLIEPVLDSPRIWKAQDESRRFGDAKASIGIRKLHFQLLKQIPGFAENCEKDERELSSSLLQLDSSQVQKLSSLIRDFAKNCLSEGNKASKNSKRLYGLSIQLFPIETKKENL